MKTTDSTLSITRERRAIVLSGWLALLVILGCLAFCAATILQLVNLKNSFYIFPEPITELGKFGLAHPVLAISAGLLAFFARACFFTVQPNEAVVLVFFGSYWGTVRKNGFFWAIPFLNKLRISLRARNLNGEKLKVNDKRGNPIEIAAVVVWRVDDTAKARFDVDNFERYVAVQSESCVRHLASTYAYDDSSDSSDAAHADAAPEPTLRTSGDLVAAELERELQVRLARAGVVVEEARLTHLAYAPEIAQAMLRRQQAEAVIAARQKIVHGAVSMVEMALKDLSEKNVVVLDDERKAAMVSNLLVVLCGETEVHPVVNAGTLYS